MEDFQRSDAAQRWWQKPATQKQLAKARAAEWVDYTAVMQLKLAALKLAFPLFQARKPNDAQRQAFERFVTEGGDSLYQQAAFDALHAHGGQRRQPVGMAGPPEGYRRGQSEAVRQFCDKHQDAVRFYLWLQWLAATQFAQCFEQSRQQQMPIGLYRDLAVGVAEGGAETRCDRELYCLKASVGAPPDIPGRWGKTGACRRWIRT